MRLLRAVTCGIAAVALAACGETSTPVLAQFLGSEGEAYLVSTSSGQGARQPLEPGTRIAAGDTLETGDDATALVALLPNLVLRLNGATALTIEDVQLTKNGNSMTYPIRRRAAHVRLHRGSLCATTPRDFAATEITMAAGSATITAAEWSAFYVALRGDSLRVTNPQHRLHVDLRGSRQVLERGYYLETGNAAIGRPIVPRLIVVDEQAADEAALAGETQELVAELTARLREAPPPWRR